MKDTNKLLKDEQIATYPFEGVRYEEPSKEFLVTEEDILSFPTKFNKEQMIKEDIYFAGESSGHFYLNTSIGCFEYPTIMILKLLYEFSQINEPISEYLKQYQRYFGSGEINREVKDKNIIFEKIKNTFSDAQINTLDGISVTYPDFWFNVRGSNTEEKVRLNLEAISNDLMLEKTATVLALIENQ
jgi:phosphomannomutase